jgi:hypothetical protein
MKDFRCDTLVEQATEVLEGRLSPTDRAALDVHLRLCAGCRNYLDQLRATLDLLGRVPSESITPEALAVLGSIFEKWKATRGNEPVG